MENCMHKKSNVKSLAVRLITHHYGQVAGLETCLFINYGLVWGTHEQITINAPSHSEVVLVLSLD